MEAVSKVGHVSESCHDLSRLALHCPHPNPLPEGEGAVPEPLLKSPRPLGEGQGEGYSCYDSACSMSFETASMPRPYNWYCTIGGLIPVRCVVAD